MSFREIYKSGIRETYRHLAHYENPHEPRIASALEVVKTWNLDTSHALDLAAGSGEVTRHFPCTEGFDPFLFRLYTERTGKPCYPYSFEDIALDKIAKKYSLVICSYALHLLPQSWIPSFMEGLSSMTDTLVVLSPHKRPIIKQWQLVNCVVVERIHCRCFRLENA